MEAKPKSSEYMSISKYRPYLRSDLSADAQNPENVDGRADRWTDKWVAMPPFNLVHDKNVVRN